MVLRGQSAPQLLDSYQRERHPHVKATTETAKSLGRIICELDPAKAAERDARMLRDMGDPPAVQIRQNLIPGLKQGALCSDQGAPVGTRFPQPRIASKAGERLLDDLVGTSFRLLVSPAIAPRDIPEALRRKVVKLGGTVLSLSDGECSQPTSAGEWSIVEADGLLQAWMRDHSLLAALVRPDHYVFAVAREHSDLDAISDLLERHLHLAGG
jgi:3-(3-hydroxy-phenyl)propionate hydroxylase